MNRYEWREILSLAPADILLWVASFILVVMKFTSDPVKDSILAVSAIILSSASCFIGMKRDERVSEMTNRLKKISYPLFMVLTIILLYVNF